MVKDQKFHQSPDGTVPFTYPGFNSGSFGEEWGQVTAFLRDEETSSRFGTVDHNLFRQVVDAGCVEKNPKR